MSTFKDFKPTYRIEVQTHLIYKLYTVQSNQINKDIIYLLSENNTLQNYTSNKDTYVWFDSKPYYRLRTNTAYSKEIPLHEDAAPRLANLIYQKESLEKEKVLVKGYLRRVLNKCNGYSDLVKLLPKAVQNDIPSLRIQKSYLIPTKLSSNDVRLFNEENAKYIELLKRRLLTNMLLNQSDT